MGNYKEHFTLTIRNSFSTVSDKNQPQARDIRLAKNAKVPNKKVPAPPADKIFKGTIRTFNSILGTQMNVFVEEIFSKLHVALASIMICVVLHSGTAGGTEGAVVDTWRSENN